MKYIKYSVLFLFIIFGATYICFYRTGYNKYYSLEIEDMNEIINGTKYHDLLFLGSSRSYYHINPKIIDSIAKTDSYNAGMTGANLLEMNMILQCYLKKHKAPKYVFLDLAWTSFDIDKRAINNPNIYYPFLDNEIIFNTLKQHNRVQLLKYLPFLQSTEADDLIRQEVCLGLLGQKKHANTDFYKGYFKNSIDTIKLPFKPLHSKYILPVSERGIGFLKQIINSCKEKNINLVIIYPPTYKIQDADLNPQFFHTIKKVCNDDHLPFLDYKNISLSNDHRLFRDELHLNEEGANLFSIFLAKDIKRYMAENLIKSTAFELSSESHHSQAKHKSSSIN